jgi:DNA-binding NtrC family response regulator
MDSRLLGLVPFATPTETRSLESALRALGQAARIISPATWFTAAESSQFAGPTILFLGERDYPSRDICSMLEARQNSVVVIFARDVACFCQEIAISCQDFIYWPCANQELGFRIERLWGPQVRQPPPRDEAALLEEFADLNLLGCSPVFVAALKLIKRVARCDAPVLIDGETGTGKELTARAIHYLSARRDQPFIPVNCGAVPDNLFENELFGHARGAYTDAREAQPGLVALADGGTLFLDEVDALSAKGQVALLRFLQDQHYRPLGGRETRRADIRILAAANVDVGALVAQGRFRSDLMFRLRVLAVTLPPLRQRHGDIALLAEHFLNQYRRRYDQPRKRFAPETLRWLLDQPWPGNVREIESFIHREFVLAEGDTVRMRGAQPSVPEQRTELSERPGQSPPRDIGLKECKARVIAEFEKDYLIALLAETGGNVSQAARRAGKERRALGKLLKKHGIERPSRSNH